MGRCEQCGWMAPALKTYEVRCVECRKMKWPTLPACPDTYTCALCRGGVSTSRREVGRRNAAKKKSLRTKQEGGRDVEPE